MVVIFAMSSALFLSLAICGVAALLEGVCAGGGIKARLAELRTPLRLNPPLWVWVLIGIGYYVICFAVLYRCFSLPPSGLRKTALALLGGMMLSNALWNVFFFRTRNLFHAFLIGVPYSAVAVLLFFLLLCGLDRPSAWWLSPYLGYLFFANVFGYKVWKLNPPRSPP